MQPLTDQGDETKWLLLETWESAEHVAAYQQYRKTHNVPSELGPLVASPPAVTNYSISEV